jgi:hypothetical protein
VPPGKYQVRFTLSDEDYDSGFIFNNTNGAKISTDGRTLIYTVDVSEGETNLTIDATVTCPCSSIVSDSFPSLSVWALLLLMLSTLWIGGVRTRREV